MSEKTNEAIISVPLSKVYADHRWNFRSGKWTEDSDPTTGDGFTGLMDSIKTAGQDVPCVVRPYAKGGEKVPYQLVTGFRRFEAIRLIGKEKGEADPMLRVVVKNLTDSQARALNMRENGARENPKAADWAWAIMDMLRLNPGQTDTSIAQELGKSKSYIANLHRVMNGLGGPDTPVAKLWRESAVLVPVPDMIQLAEQCPRDRQEEEFRKMVAPKAVDPEKGPKSGPNAWKETYRSAFENIGETLGYLQACEVLEIYEEALENPEEWMGRVKKIPTKADGRDRNSFAKALSRGIAAGEKRKQDEDAAEEQEAEEEAKAAKQEALKKAAEAKKGK